MIFFIPISETTAKIYVYWSNFAIPFAVCSFAFFFDILQRDKLSYFSIIFSLLGGFGLGVYLVPDEVFIKYLPNLVFGDFWTTEFASPKVLAYIYLLFLAMILLTIKCFLIAQEYHKLHQPLIKRFFLIMGWGNFTWISMTFLKRIFPRYCYGMDIFGMALIYSLLIIGYIRKKNLFTLLPGGLIYLIISAKEGEHLIDYDFFHHKVIDPQQLFEGDTALNLIRFAFPGTASILEDSASFSEPSGNLQNLQFQGIQLLYHSSDHLNFLLFTRIAAKPYQNMLKRIAGNIEKHFPDLGSIDSPYNQIPISLINHLDALMEKYY